MRFSYVLPDPASYGDWDEFEGDLACMKLAGYDAVELQISDPAQFDEHRVRRSLETAHFAMCAFQTGSSYASHGNCLCTPEKAVRQRTIELLRSFVDLAQRCRAVVVFGSLQGRRSDEPDREVGETRIREAMREIGQHATAQGVVVAFEPVQHGEVGFHNTIAEVADLVRGINLPGLHMMIDTFHMNIEERDMLRPLAVIGDVLAHVHLCETNRDVLGAGHWPTAEFLAELDRIRYHGYCSLGVYHTRRPRRECIRSCMEELRRITAGMWPRDM